MALCEQFHWTERQLRDETTVLFVRQINLYNELMKKSEKVRGTYEPAKPTVRTVGRGSG